MTTPNVADVMPYGVTFSPLNYQQQFLTPVDAPGPHRYGVTGLLVPKGVFVMRVVSKLTAAIRLRIKYSDGSPDNQYEIVSAGGLTPRRFQEKISASFNLSSPQDKTPTSPQAVASHCKSYRCQLQPDGGGLNGHTIDAVRCTTRAITEFFRNDHPRWVSHTRLKSEDPASSGSGDAQVHLGRLRATKVFHLARWSAVRMGNGARMVEYGSNSFISRGRTCTDRAGGNVCANGSLYFTGHYQCAMQRRCNCNTNSGSLTQKPARGGAF